MHVISKKAIKIFYDQHQDAKEPLQRWYKQISKKSFGNLAELKTIFPSVDLVDNFFVFNIGGNKYRLITAIHFNVQKVFGSTNSKRNCYVSPQC